MFINSNHFTCYILPSVGFGSRQLAIAGSLDDFPSEVLTLTGISLLARWLSCPSKLSCLVRLSWLSDWLVVYAKSLRCSLYAAWSRDKSNWNLLRTSTSKMRVCIHLQVHRVTNNRQLGFKWVYVVSIFSWLCYCWFVHTKKGKAFFAAFEL